MTTGPELADRRSDPDAPTERLAVPSVLREPRRRLSLRARVTLLAGVGVGVATALVSLAAFLTVQSSLYSQLDENLLQRAGVAVNSPLVQQNVLQAIPAAAFGAADLRVGLITEQDRTAYAEGAPPPPFGRPELNVATGDTSFSLRTANGLRVVAVPAGPGLALVIAQPLAPTQSTLARLGLVLGLVGAAGIVLAALAGLAVARAGLRPVQQLTAAAERVAATGDLQPIPVTGGDELARLTQSFNAMLAALASSQERQRRLVADAGHELRTPLTSLRTNLELLIAANQPGAPPLSLTDRADIQADLRAQVDELSTLVGDVVELARDEGSRTVPELLDFTEVVERALDRARRRAAGISFDVRLVPWTVRGEANGLERAVLNLMDNAAKWSPPDGRVGVALRPLGDGTAVLEIADSGPGIAEADLPYVFDRFYRSVSARALPGSGLGLAIVKQVAERHGGGVWADRAPRGGALLVFRLPGAHPDGRHDLSGRVQTDGAG